MTDNTPVLLGRGKYAIYQTPEGEGIIAYRPENTDADNHVPIPKAVWGVMLSALKGEKIDMSPMAVMKLMMGK